MSLPHRELGESWAADRPPPAVLHLDHASCSRVSTAVLDVQAAHLRHEAEIGGYAAQAAAEPVLAAGLTAVGGLLGLGPGDLGWCESAQSALASMLSCWPGLVRGARVAVTRSEYGPSVAWLIDHDLDVLDLPDDDAGVTDLDALPAWLDRQRPVLVVVTHLASQRGLAQPAAAIAAACRAAGVDVVVDCAQSLGHLRCDDIGADGYVATSRKWLAGPRGVGVLGVTPAAAARLELRAPALSARWQPGEESAATRLGSYEAHVAGRVGLAVAVAQHVAAGPERVRERLAALGAATTEAVDGVAGWTLAPGQTTSAIRSFLPPDGVDPLAVRETLRARGVLTTYAGIERAPRDRTPPLLRISPHLDTTEADLEAAAEALAAASR
jgi:pyridoxal 5-phosphate dependent beta-lyase